MTHSKYNIEIERQDSEAAKTQFDKDIRRILAEDSIVIDVGANKGQFAKELLTKTKVKAIYSFEPVPNCFGELESMKREYKNFFPIMAAVSKESAVTRFYVTESDIGSSLLKPIAEQPSKWLTMEREILVDSIRLDDFIRQEFTDSEQQIARLKCDAQGADLEVLESAGDELIPRRIRAVLVEVNFVDFYEGQNPYHKVFAALDKRGYRLARLYTHRAYDDWLWMGDALFLDKSAQ